MSGTDRKLSFNDIIIIWLDESVNSLPQYSTLQSHKSLLSCVRCAHPFMDARTCQDYIEKMSDYRILLIVSDSLNQQFIPQIHELPQISYIYIYCLDTGEHSIPSEKWVKVRGFYNEENLLFKILTVDIQSLNDTHFSFGLFEPGQGSTKALATQKATFIWSQIILEVLIRLRNSLNAKSEMIAECQVNYKDNGVQLENIDLFEKTYRECDAIKWYTSNGFLFQLFNKAFRQQDFEIIFKYRFFLLDLYSQIECLYKEQISKSQNHLIVYRGQMMSNTELMKLHQNIGSLISINTFFSTSFSSAVAVNFCGDGEYESYGIVSVMFEIDIDTNTPNRPFACIEKSSNIQDEREVLFSMGAVFLVESVVSETDTIWFVKLVWNHETHEKLKEMEQVLRIIDSYATRRIGDNPSTVLFGYILSEMGLLREALRFYLYLWKTLPEDHKDRAALYNNLGEVFRKRKFHDLARCQYMKALNLCIENMSMHHPFFAIVHSNIGLLNLDCGAPKEALKSYQCAYFLLFRCLKMDETNSMDYIQEALANVYHGMGTALFALEKYSNAINFHKKALKIEQKIFPDHHPTFTDSFHKLAVIYMRTKRYAHALEACEISLKIAQHNFIDKDERFLPIHLDMAYLRLYFEKDESKALQHCNFARQILLQNAANAFNPCYIYYYKKLTSFYFELSFPRIALDMWFGSIEISRVDLLSRRVEIDEIQSNISHALLANNSKIHFNRCYLILPDILPLKHVSMLENMCCELADEYRKSGYTERAIYCYSYLLEHKLIYSREQEFDHILVCRLHNNLAACYQDLNENKKALFHYQTSLRILSTDHKKYNLLLYIVNYNIALIYIELDDLVLAEQHLHETIAKYELCSRNDVGIMDIEVNRQLIKIYKKRGNSQMVRNCYDYIINQMKIDKAPQTLIDKYEKFAENTLTDMANNQLRQITLQ